MNKKIKIGSLLFTMGMPIAAIVSCTEKKPTTFDDGTFGAHKTFAINHYDWKMVDKHAKKLLKDAKEGMWITKESYHSGLLGEGTKDNWQSSSKDFMPLGQWKGWSGSDQEVMEFADGDSFYVKYDNNDDDGFTPDTFLKNVWLNDTSISQDKRIIEINKALGHPISQESFGSVPRISFSFDRGSQKSGYLQSWVGSQTNHLSKTMTFNTAIKNLYKHIKTKDITKETFSHLADYYGVLNYPNENGVFEDNDKIINHASRAFFPVLQGTGYFTFKKISKLIFRITFNNKVNVSTTAAIWRFSPAQNPYADEDDVDKTLWKKEQSFGPFSLGEKNEWEKYENHKMKYKFRARKNIFLNRS